MDPLLGGLITGGASLMGSMFSADTSAKNTQAQIQAQQSMLNQTEAYNTQMSNTAYQRAKADMTAAGLNPMMMASGGMAASSPSVGTPNVPMPQTQSPLGGVGDAVGKAVNTAISAQTFNKMTEEIANLQVEQARGRAQTNLAQSEEALTLQKKGTETAETERRRAEAEQARLRIPGAQVEESRAKAFLKMPQWLQDLTVQGSTVGRSVSDVVSPLANSARAVRQFMPRSSSVDEQGWRDPVSGDWSRQRYERSQ